MHSNGGRDLVPEPVSPAVGESRRGYHPAALVRRRSFGGTRLIVGASGEFSWIVSAMNFSELVVYAATMPSRVDSLGAQRN
jgi:hypothetical protein